jgi:hypothetical protein
MLSSKKLNLTQQKSESEELFQTQIFLGVMKTPACNCAEKHINAKLGIQVQKAKMQAF